MDVLFIIAIILDLVLIGQFLLFFFYFLKESMDKEDDTKSPFYKPYALYFLLICIAEVLNFYSIITSPVEYRFLNWKNPDVGVVILGRIVLLLRAFGYAAIIYTIEKNLFKDKKFLYSVAWVIATIIGMVLLFTLPEELGAIGMLVSAIIFFFTFVIPIGYFYIGYKSTGTVRKKALLIGLGFVLLLVATSFITRVGLEVSMENNLLDPTSLFIISCIMRICGTFIIFWGFK